MKLEEYNKKKNVESSQPPYSAQHPWLLISHGEKLENQTFFSVSEDRYYKRRISELKEKFISAHVDEWLLLESVYSSDCYLWNLISNDRIQLPPLPAECNILECLLSAPPHDPDCQILFIIQEIENVEDDENVEDVNLPTFYFCKPGCNEEFHKQDVQSIVEDWYLGIWTVFKKKIYILTGQTNALLRLDLDNDSGKITVTLMANESPIMQREYMDMQHFKKHLVQSSNANDDMLLYLHLYFNGKDEEIPYHFLVFMFDFVEKRWIEIESIGEIAIFVNRSSGTVCSTRGTNLNGESIYFNCGGRYLYVYNLMTHSISLSLPCPHVPKKNVYMRWLTLN